MAIENPLLDFSGLPRFGRIEAEHIVPAIAVLLDDARRAVDRVARDTGLRRGRRSSLRPKRRSTTWTARGAPSGT